MQLIPGSSHFHSKLFFGTMLGENCPGFYNWFLTHCKKEFLQSVIQFAREGTNVVVLFCQNDIDSIHAIEKSIQCLKMGSVLEAVNTIKILTKRE